jgi:hypothetical protein
MAMGRHYILQIFSIIYTQFHLLVQSGKYVRDHRKDYSFPKRKRKETKGKGEKMTPNTIG